MTITIVNYGCGNIGSIPNMLRRCGAQSVIVNTPDELINANKIILPGVGAFGYAMDCLTQGGFIDILNRKVVTEKTPILGICLGMQLLGKSSEESTNVAGLSWINGHLRKFVATDNSIKIPHMGWNHIDIQRPNHPLLKYLNDARFYYVHSYHYGDLAKDDIIATAHHGYDFPTIIAHQNIMGVQFHPEKSHRYGLQLLKNFTEYAPC